MRDVRTLTWIELDDLTDTTQANIPHAIEATSIVL